MSGITQLSVCTSGYDMDEWEVSRDNIRLIKELGQGSFGTVWEGHMIQPDKSVVSVAVKVATAAHL